MELMHVYEYSIDTQHLIARKTHTICDVLARYFRYIKTNHNLILFNLMMQWLSSFTMWTRWFALWRQTDQKTDDKPFDLIFRQKNLISHIIWIYIYICMGRMYTLMQSIESMSSNIWCSYGQFCVTAEAVLRSNLVFIFIREKFVI